MKVLDIALKDLSRSFRSAFALVFMFVIPLLTVGLFYFAFGSLGSDDGGFDLPATKVQVVNLDEPNPQYGNFSAGGMLVELLESEELADLLEVTEATNGADARTAVDDQEAGVAIIIPADFTAAAFDPEGHAAVELYQDPTLTVGPGIVKGIISQFVDAFAGSRIAAGVAYDQLAEHGATVDAATLQAIAMQYADWSASLGESQKADTFPLFEIRSLPGTGEETTNQLVQILSLIMMGMMIFYAFFTGANSSQSILQEEEAGTLPRLFTTPTPQSTILGGKFIATFATIFVQVVVLMIISTLVFKMKWGQPLALALAALGLVVLTASFGIFLTSLLKDTKQTGVVIGGVMTVTGMVGISSMFTGSIPGASQAGKVTDIISLFTPQGWAMRGWLIVMNGGDGGDVLPTILVMLALGVGFFLIGVLRFRKRFA